MRQHNYAKRQHPESQYWQKPQHTADDEQRARRDAPITGSWHRDADFSEIQFAIFGIDSKFHRRITSLSLIWPKHPKLFSLNIPCKMGPFVNKTRRMHFF